MRSRWLGSIAVGLLVLAGCAQAPASETSLPATTPAAAQPAPAGAGTVAATNSSVATATARPTAVPASAGTATPAGPLLAVTTPADDTVEVPSTATSAIIAGHARADATVSVNGQLVQTDQTGAFRVEVPLADDLTVVDVVASDEAGQEAHAEYVFVRE